MIIIPQTVRKYHMIHYANHDSARIEIAGPLNIIENVRELGRRYTSFRVAIECSSKPSVVCL